MSTELHEVDRQEIFSEIVRMQDGGVTVDDSRNRIAGQFGIDVDEVREVEREGITKKWPPL
jgi:hypothetical protein